LRIDRYLTHALLLAIAVALSGYTRDMDHHFPAYLTARPGPVNAEALVVSAGGTVGAVRSRPGCQPNDECDSRPSSCAPAPVCRLIALLPVDRLRRRGQPVEIKQRSGP
jgi:hypothetical protein